MGLCDGQDSINMAREPQQEIGSLRLGRSEAGHIQDLSRKKMRDGTTHSAEDWVNIPL